MARGFDGTNDYLSYAAPVLTAVPITFAAWFYLNNTLAAVKTVMAIGGLYTATRQEFVMYVSGTGFYVVTQNGTYGTATSTAVLSATTWYHGCGVFAAINDRRAFINGADKGTNATSKTPITTSLTRTAIGQRGNTADDQKMNGQIAEAGIWNIALTDEEVAVLATGISPLAVHPANLVAYWPLIGNYSPEIDVVGGYGMAATGAPSKQPHPRVRYPANSRALKATYVAPPPAGGGPMLAHGKYW